MKVLDAKFAREFIDLCDRGWKKGWHERNGGNLSYRMKNEEAEEVKDDLDFASTRVYPIGAKVTTLANEFFMVKATGGFMMHMKDNPLHNCGIIQLDEKGENYKILWGFSDGMKPTSELPSHLMNLAVVKERTNGLYRVVYHCHPANIIALTFVLPLTDESFTKVLWSAMTECPIIFPAGVGVVPWMVPGGDEIAIRTSELMKTYDLAIWAHHGIFGTADTFDNAFGLIDAAEKSAEIAVKVIAMGGAKQTMTDEDIVSLEDRYHIHANRKFLHLKK